MRIAHLSDLHFGTEADGALAGLEESLDRYAPELVIVTGDLTQRARKREFLAARAFLGRLRAPYVVVPGNHDIAPMYRPLERWLAPYERYRRYIRAELDMLFVDDRLLVLGLNTVNPWAWKEGTIHRSQLDWLSTRTASFCNRINLVATHHPLSHAHLEAPAPRLRHRQSLVAALDKTNVHLCLTGHVHHGTSGPSVDTAAKGSLLVIQASTAISTRLRGHPNSYNQLELGPGEACLRLQSFDGQRFSGVEPLSFVRRAGSWQVA
jgi:3',5'-cyclic AMP phosphodiesterase CpdA